jgi:hypothetical protein
VTRSDGERYRTSYRFGTLERRGIAGGLRPAQVVLLGAACVLAVAIFRRMPTPAGLALGAALVATACAATWLPVAGRPVDEWAPIIAGWLAMQVLADRKYRSRGPWAGVAVDLGKSKGRRLRELPAPIDRVEILSVPLSDDRCLGVFVDRRAGTYTAVAGLRVRSFGLLAAAEQERRLERWGRALASLARDGGPVRRVQLMERTLPHDEDQLARWLASAGDDSVPPGDPLRRSYGELLESAAAVTQDHEVLVALQVDPRRSRTARAASGRPQSPDEAGVQLALGEIRMLAQRLETIDVGIAGLLDAERCAWTLRLAYEPGLRSRSSRLAHAEPGQLGPTAAETLWDRYRCDGAVHRSYWIAQWPRVDVGPAFLAPLLLTATAVRSFSVVIEPVAPARSRSAVEAAVTSDEADEQLRSERGFRTPARRRKQQAATRRREAELAEGHEELRFAGFVTVSGTSDEDLERGCEEVHQAAQQAYLDLQPMWGQQDVGFICGALPLCHGLARGGLLDR